MSVQSSNVMRTPNLADASTPAGASDADSSQYWDDWQEKWDQLDADEQARQWELIRQRGLRAWRGFTRDTAVMQDLLRLWSHQPRLEAGDPDFVSATQLCQHLGIGTRDCLFMGRVADPSLDIVTAHLLPHAIAHQYIHLFNGTERDVDSYDNMVRFAKPFEVAFHNQGLALWPSSLYQDFDPKKQQRSVICRVLDTATYKTKLGATGKKIGDYDRKPLKTRFPLSPLQESILGYHYILSIHSAYVSTRGGSVRLGTTRADVENRIADYRAAYSGVLRAADLLDYLPLDLPRAVAITDAAVPTV